MKTRTFSLATALFAVSCTANYPKEIWLDSAFSPTEEKIILSAMNRWEEQTEQNLFLYKGRRHTDVFRKESLGDEFFVVYKVEDLDSDDAQYVWVNREGYYGVPGRSGWATSADMLIFSFTVHKDKSEEDYLRSLFSVCLHEFGHVLLLGHINEQDAIMRPGYYDDKCLNAADLDAFCSVNGCASGFSPQESTAECLLIYGDIDVLESSLD